MWIHVLCYTFFPYCKYRTDTFLITGSDANSLDLETDRVINNIKKSFDESRNLLQQRKEITNFVKNNNELKQELTRLQNNRKRGNISQYKYDNKIFDLEKKYNLPSNFFRRKGAIESILKW